MGYEELTVVFIIQFFLNRCCQAKNSSHEGREVFSTERQKTERFHWELADLELIQQESSPPLPTLNMGTHPYNTGLSHTV